MTLTFWGLLEFCLMRNKIVLDLDIKKLKFLTILSDTLS